MTGSPITTSAWDKRIARAAVLEHSWAPAAELLGFYRQIAEFQKAAAQSSRPVSLEPLLTLLAQAAHAPLAQIAEALLRTPALWQDVLDTPVTPAEAFLSQIVKQPYQETLARRRGALPPAVQPICPFCGAHPLVAILRPEGDGAKRSLLCNLCFTEWDFRRILCPHCGEEDKDKLPVYTAEEFPHIRVEACDTCRSYIKSVDLTRNGLAVPEVDELASIPLDLWAAENGYSKLQPNLFGL
jgi:FdhE protein